MAMKKYNWKKSQMHKEWKIIAMTNGNLGKYKLNYLRKGDRSEIEKLTVLAEICICILAEAFRSSTDFTVTLKYTLFYTQASALLKR